MVMHQLAIFGHFLAQFTPIINLDKKILILQVRHCITIV